LSSLQVGCQGWRKLNPKDFFIWFTGFFFSPRFLFRHPKNHQTRNVFLSPFSLDLWLGLMVLLVMFGLMLFAIKVVKFVKIQQIQVKIGELLHLLLNSILVPIEIVAQQLLKQEFLCNFSPCLISTGFEGTFTMSASRITLIFLLFFTFLIAQFYSTYIVGSLLMEVPRTITNITHLVDSNFKIIFENVLYNLRYLDVKVVF
jgi:glutamate receptor, ionotropic, invertebrate